MNPEEKRVNHDTSMHNNINVKRAVLSVHIRPQQLCSQTETVSAADQEFSLFLQEGVDAGCNCDESFMFENEIILVCIVSKECPHKDSGTNVCVRMCVNVPKTSD